ncbi:DUF551 domain-containing protein [Serratia marcescens]|nr:DUF551 domain-containing protein [Serratia marcescens]
MTLTTETLNLWRNNAEITAGETAEDDPEHIAAKAILALTAELLANREAKPVALVDRRPAASGSICWQNGGKDLPHGTELFSAPPAPAIPDIGSSVVNDAAWKLHDTLTEHGPLNGHQFNNLKVCLYEALKIVMFVAPSPAVVKLPIEFYSDEGIVVRLEQIMAALAVAGVKYERKVGACRAAMLAQPVSSGYTFNSPVIPDGWIACSERMPELDKRVLLYFGSYDGHIEDGCIGDDGDGPYHYFFDGDSLQQEPTHWMPLPAAPEGGNG